MEASIESPVGTIHGHKRVTGGDKDPEGPRGRGGEIRIRGHRVRKAKDVYGHDRTGRHVKEARP